MSYLNTLYADFYKMKHTFLPWLHFLIPVSYALLSLLIVRFSGAKNMSSEEVVSSYFVIMAAVLPMLIGLIAAKAVEMEQNAGHLLALFSGHQAKKMAFVSKWLSLFLSGSFSITLAALLFATIYGEMAPVAYLYGVMILIGCMMMMYIIHLVTAFLWGSGASTGLGIIETLISFLFLTGLGDGIWYCVPCSWGARMCATFIRIHFEPGNEIYLFELKKGLLFVCPLTIFAFAFVLWWFEHFEGRQDSE